MQAGQLRHRLTIQTLQAGRDSFGEPSQALNDGATIWGDVEHVAGGSGYRDEQFAPDVTHRVTIRAQSGLGPKMQLKYTDYLGTTHLLDIQAILDPEGRGRTFVIHCIERL